MKTIIICCSSCGANLENNTKCDYCGNIHIGNIEILQSNFIENSKIPHAGGIRYPMSSIQLKCSACGGNNLKLMFSNQLRVITKCDYCGNFQIIEGANLSIIKRTWSQIFPNFPTNFMSTEYVTRQLKCSIEELEELQFLSVHYPKEWKPDCEDDISELKKKLAILRIKKIKYQTMMEESERTYKMIKDFFVLITAMFFYVIGTIVWKVIGILGRISFYLDFNRI